MNNGVVDFFRHSSHFSSFFSFSPKKNISKSMSNHLSPFDCLKEIHSFRSLKIEHFAKARFNFPNSLFFLSGLLIMRFISFINHLYIIILTTMLLKIIINLRKSFSSYWELTIEIRITTFKDIDFRIIKIGEIIII